MKKSIFIIVSILFWAISVPVITKAQLNYAKPGEQALSLMGHVRHSFTKEYIEDAKVVRLDKDGNPGDTIPAVKSRTKVDDEIKEISMILVRVPKHDSVYMFEVLAHGCEPKRVTWEVRNVGNRESHRYMPIIFLDRAAKKLDEVTVTATKIKFYNKGDTLVYNADAFQLAEGSMLDALIAQLPGVELEDNGRITVNGRFVESLLLNGRQFLDDNRQLMLENIAAYTVKSVEVYEGQTDYEKWENDTTKRKHFTMDVRMKKEYMRGWIVNTQGGYGTRDRYMGRLFASLFTPTTNITLLGNVNNLNDNRKPGKNDSWIPEMMPSGTKSYQMGSIDYDYKRADEKQMARGNLIFEHTGLNNRVMTNRENFLTGGNTFENRFSNSTNSELKFNTQHSLQWYLSRVYAGGWTRARYTKKTQRSENISATFNSEQKEMTSKALQALYSDGDPDLLESVINRDMSRTDGSSHDADFHIEPSFTWKIPGSEDQLIVGMDFKYRDRKEERWKDFEINYGNNPLPAEKRRQYFDNSPNRTLTAFGTLGYRLRLKGGVYLSIDYEYRFTDDEKDSYMYSLDRLADMGVYGTLPAGCLDTFDPTNSYTSRLISNKHTISPSFFKYIYNSKYALRLSANVDFGFVNRHLDYWRDNRQYLVDRKDFTSTIRKGYTSIEWDFCRWYDSQTRRDGKINTIRYEISSDTKLPDLAHTIDIENTADPLNITLGNPDLKPSTEWTHGLSWSFSPRSSVRVNNSLSVNYRYTHNDIVRGYTYDTTTGIRRTRSYNVDGNNMLNIGEHAFGSFGPDNMFTASVGLTYIKNRYSDMIGVNMQEPVKSIVKSNMFMQSLKFGVSFKKQSFTITGNHTGRKTSSTREDFHLIDADNFNYGIQGTFTLPYGFGLSTDFMIYSRRGYGSKELDRDDAIWNLRATWATNNKRWVFMADAFDMLHQLSNVNYGISASGRTVTWTNALPRYILFSIQYRLTIQPKKRR